MLRETKRAYARQYARQLADEHPSIAGIILGGSVARGDDLPISDVDMLCFVDAAAGDLPIAKHPAEGFYVDIAQQAADLLRDRGVLRDAYFCGYLNDALILFDRDGDVDRCRRRIRAALGDGSYREIQLAPLRATIERNADELGAAVEAGNATGVCRASIYALWTLCDYLLASHGVAPGGARGLARLRVVDPVAADALAEYEGAQTLGDDAIATLFDLYLGVQEPSSFFDAWIAQARWLFDHGCRTDAFHALWIALGLLIQYARVGPEGLPDEALTAAARRWLEIVGWTGSVLWEEQRNLRHLIDMSIEGTRDQSESTCGST